MQRLGIGFRIQLHYGECGVRSNVIGLERQYAIVGRFFFSIAPKGLITLRSLLKQEKIVGVELDAALEISYALFPAPLTPLD